MFRDKKNINYTYDFDGSLINTKAISDKLTSHSQFNIEYKLGKSEIEH